jgi:hypothetical protein
LDDQPQGLDAACFRSKNSSEGILEGSGLRVILPRANDFKVQRPIIPTCKQFCLEHLDRLDRQANGYLGLSIEHLKDVLADQALKLARIPPTAGYLDTPIASSTFRTCDVALDHRVELRISPEPTLSVPNSKNYSGFRWEANVSGSG